MFYILDYGYGDTKPLFILLDPYKAIKEQTILHIKK